MSRHTVQRGLISILLILASTIASAQDSPAILIPNQTIGPQRPFEEDPAALWQFGYSVSMISTTALAGMFAWPDNNGRVAVFSKRGKLWKRTGTIEPLDSMVGDSFGENVLALSESLALVDGGGALYAFRLVDNEWQQLRKIEGLYGQMTGQGHTAAIDAGFIDFTGIETVEIYRVGAPGGLQLVQTLTTGEGVPLVGFGTGLAMSHNTLAIGAYSDDDGRGAVYVFNREGTRWAKRQKLVVSDSGGGFGYTLTMDGDLLVVTGPAGLYVFKRAGGLWSQQQTIGQPSSSFSFGDTLALRDDTLAVGGSAFVNGTDITNIRDQVLLYQWDGHAFKLAAQTLASQPQGSPVRVALSHATLMSGHAYFPYDVARNTFIGHGELFDLRHCRFADEAEALAQRSLQKSRRHDDPLSQLCRNSERRR
jgi:hypothetical protein